MLTKCLSQERLQADRLNNTRTGKISSRPMIMQQRERIGKVRKAIKHKEVSVSRR